MESNVTPDEAIEGYEDSLHGRPRTELLQEPYRQKEDGNRAFKLPDHVSAVQSYLRALIAFRYLLNHSILTVAEEVVDYVANVEKPAHLNLAFVYLKTGNNLGAIFHAEKALEIDPQNCKALYRLAVACANRGDYARSEDALRRAMAKEPGNSEMQLLKDRIASERKDYLKKTKEVSKRAFAAPKEPANENRTKSRSSLGMLFGLVLLPIRLLVGRIIDWIWGIVVAVVDYAMNFWIVRVPVNVCIKMPWQVLSRMLQWVRGLTGRREPRDKQT